MRNTGRVQGDHTFSNMFTAHKVAVYIIQYLITVDIAVMVRCRDRQRVVVEQARYKRTDYKIMCIEVLVYRWWLVYAAGNRLEIVYADGIRILATIPTHNIEWMVTVPDRVHEAFFLGIDQELTFNVESLQVLWLADVALAERSILQQLSVTAQVAFREGNRTERVNDKQAVLFCFEFDLVDAASRNYQVIAVAKRDLAILCFQYAFANMYEDHFVRISIFEKYIAFESLGRGCQCKLYIIIK
ncbi:hypothetical protein D3C72_853960 [compost metagenome]